MSFTKVDVKDRVVEHPQRIKLTDTDTGAILGTFDYDKVPGIISAEGTPQNKAFEQPTQDSLYEAMGDATPIVVELDSTDTTKSASGLVAGGPCEVVFGGSLDVVSGVLEPSRGTAVSVCGKNHFDKTNYLDGYLNGTGILLTGGSQHTTNYITVKSSTSYVISGNTRRLWEFYDSDKNFLSSITSDGVLIPSNAKYTRIYFSVLGRDLDTFQLEEGTIATTYEPFDGNTVVVSNPRALLPNGKEDTIETVNGKLRAYAKTNVLNDGELYPLKSSDINQLNNLTNVQEVRISKPLDYIGLGETLDTDNTFRLGDITLSSFNFAEKDDIANENKISAGASNGDFIYILPLGTYSTLVEAQTDLVDTQLAYELAALQEFDLPIVELLNAPLGYANFSVTDDNIIPSVTITIQDSLINSYIKTAKNVQVVAEQTDVNTVQLNNAIGNLGGTNVADFVVENSRFASWIEPTSNDYVENVQYVSSFDSTFSSMISLENNSEVTKYNTAGEEQEYDGLDPLTTYFVKHFAKYDIGGKSYYSEGVVYEFTTADELFLYLDGEEYSVITSGWTVAGSAVKTSTTIDFDTTLSNEATTAETIIDVTDYVGMIYSVDISGATGTILMKCNFAGASQIETFTGADTGTTVEFVLDISAITSGRPLIELTGISYGDLLVSLTEVKAVL